jgi:hypothetical protein
MGEHKRRKQTGERGSAPEPRRWPHFIFVRQREVERGAPWLALAGTLFTEFPKEVSQEQSEEIGAMIRLLVEHPGDLGGDIVFQWGWSRAEKPADHGAIEDKILDALEAKAGSGDPEIIARLTRHAIITVRVDKSGDSQHHQAR